MHLEKKIQLVAEINLETLFLGLKKKPFLSYNHQMFQTKINNFQCTHQHLY